MYGLYFKNRYKGLLNTCIIYIFKNTLSSCITGTGILSWFPRQFARLAKIGSEANAKLLLKNTRGISLTKI